MLAKEARVPVVACVETYKFGERVVLDGVGANELGDPEGVLRLPGTGKTVDDGGIEGITGLSLMYDLTPPSLITAVCTEVSYIDHTY
jgi:translation initiation factor eIF-2B subunit delta